MRIIKIKAILEFHVIIKKIIKTLKHQLENYENHKQIIEFHVRITLIMEI